MKILFITGSLVHGGAERHTITLANRLAERGHQCHFAYVKNDPSQLARIHGAASVECLHAARYLDGAAARRLRRRLQDWKGLARTALVAALGSLLAWGVTEVFLAQALPIARLAAGAVVLAVVYALFILRRGSNR